MTPRTCAPVLCLLLLTACRNADADRGAASGTRLAVAESPEIGRYLTDASGRALYALLSDGKGESGCYDACAVDWPPVPGADPPVESTEPAVQPELVATLARRDGVRQLTYAGHALYFRQGSAPSGAPDRVLTDRHGRWSLLFPHGEPMAAPVQ